LPDLIGTSFHYQVQADRHPVLSQRVDGPLPFNAAFNLVNTTVKNVGPTDAAPFTVAIYASQDSTIDTSDVLLGRVQTGALAAGAERLITLDNLVLPQNLPWSGRIHLGMVIDLQGDVPEANEQNNANVAAAVDHAIVQLYDPIAPRELWLGQDGRPLEFRSRTAVYRFLKRQGYQNLAFDNPLSRSLPRPATFSRYTGRTMPAGAFRTEAYSEYSAATRTWRIRRQLSEPSPAALRQWGSDYPYVLSYHLRF
jgi:hypothetical protein